MAQDNGGFTSKSSEIQELLRKQTELAQISMAKRQELRENPIEEVIEEEVPEIIIPTVSIRDKNTAVTTFVGLSGISMSDTGEITKTAFFELLAPSPEQYPDIQMTPEEAARISRSMRNLTTGINAAVPMTCKGTQCPFANSCIYVQERKIPLGRPCLVEKQLIEFWTRQFVDEFNVDINNTTELYMVSELAEFNIYEKRITHYLAEKHQDLLQDVVVGIDQQTGSEIINQEISRAWDLKERIKKSRMKVLEALMATRKERVKIKLDDKSNITPSEQIAELRNKMDDINRTIKKIRTVDAEIVGDNHDSKNS